MIQQSGRLGHEQLLKLSIAKGGTSVLAHGYLIMNQITRDQAEFLFGFGVFLQLLDDLQDLRRDLRAKHETLFSLAAIKHGRIDEIVLQLLHFMNVCFGSHRSVQLTKKKHSSQSHLEELRVAAAGGGGSSRGILWPSTCRVARAVFAVSLPYDSRTQQDIGGEIRTGPTKTRGWKPAEIRLERTRPSVPVNFGACRVAPIGYSTGRQLAKRDLRSTQLHTNRRRLKPSPSLPVGDASIRSAIQRRACLILGDLRHQTKLACVEFHTQTRPVIRPQFPIPKVIAQRQVGNLSDAIARHFHQHGTGKDAGGVDQGGRGNRSGEVRDETDIMRLCDRCDLHEFRDATGVGKRHARIVNESLFDEFVDVPSVPKLFANGNRYFN